VVVFTRDGDRLSVEAADALSLNVSGPFAEPLGDVQSNLVWKAASLLQSRYAAGLGARIHLEKRLPIASGMGGGSSDAATCVRLLESLWGIAWDEAERTAFLLGLGADLPVCYHQHPVRMQGIGEQLTPLSIPSGLPILLVNPGVMLATAEVFRAYAADTPPFSAPLNLPDDMDSAEAVAKLLREGGNDLTRAAITRVPEVAAVLQAIGQEEASLAAGMSGSGATCIGIFANCAAAQRAATRLRAQHPNWWVLATQTG
jgi:4-diphosphocytidyl-2-C-methyl-D-erythritol kinase